MRVADYVYEYLANYGIKHVFLVSGGGSMHLNDALKKQKRIRFVCNHHEQAAAIAAEGYARTSGKLSVVNVTSGPGGTNTLTGVIGQWLDSVPVLYLSGQVKYETTIDSVLGSQLRQLGDQEINIVDIVRPVTKYSKMITDPGSIKGELDKALSLATSGRPGPVWLDIPLDVQGALIDKERLKSQAEKIMPPVADDTSISRVVAELAKAKRPVVIAGHGIKISRAENLFSELLNRLEIPVVTTFNGFDLLASDSTFFVGRMGTLGSRAGNFAVQNSDLVICLGTRNNIRQVSYNWMSFARHAKKIVVDIDEAELNKKTVKCDIPIHSDVNIFLDRLIERLPRDVGCDPSWLHWCLDRKKKYPVVLDTYRTPCDRAVHPYVFMEKLTDKLDESSIVVAGNGSACVILFQAGIVKKGQRIFWNSGCASMGYALPAAIGAALAGNRTVICLTGDGSFQMNLQELQTIIHNDLPVKILILNNHGYSSIQQTQEAFFDSDFIGCNEASGVSFPDSSKLATAYGFPFFKIDSTTHMEEVLERVLRHEGRLICEVVLVDDYTFAPKLSSERKPDGRIVSKPLEDLYPFLDRDEFHSNMIVKDPCENND